METALVFLMLPLKIYLPISVSQSTCFMLLKKTPRWCLTSQGFKLEQVVLCKTFSTLQRTSTQALASEVNTYLIDIFSLIFLRTSFAITKKYKTAKKLTISSNFCHPQQISWLVMKFTFLVAVAGMLIIKWVPKTSVDDWWQAQTSVDESRWVIRQV